jgi:MSHA biogenesis protein MshO
MNVTTSRRQRGFTLIEAIMVIVIIGILAAMVAVFIRGPIQGYVDSAGRAELTDEADLALRRMARDLRLALPNSIRAVGTDGHAIEFLLTKGGGRYLASDDAEANDTTQWALEFERTNASKPLQFTVVGAMPSLSQHLMDDLFNYVVVYNLGPGFAPADAYQLGQANSNIALIQAPMKDAAQNLTGIQLYSNPFLTQTPSMPSPAHRFQVISGAVTYWCGLRNGKLTLMRYWNYGINAAASDPPSGGVSAILATNLATCGGLFNSSTLRTQHSGLVILRLSLNAHNQQDPPLTLVDQVHVDNTP